MDEYGKFTKKFKITIYIQFLVNTLKLHNLHSTYHNNF